MPLLRSGLYTEAASFLFYQQLDEEGSGCCIQQVAKIVVNNMCRNVVVGLDDDELSLSVCEHGCAE